MCLFHLDEIGPPGINNNELEQKLDIGNVVYHDECYFPAGYWLFCHTNVFCFLAEALLI